MVNQKRKVLVIVGPTSSGKSDLAVRLAKKFRGEVISADSRQVYKGLNSGTGKITRTEMKGVRHHLLDVAEPKSQFTASDFFMSTKKAIAEIVDRSNLPIVAGGTGFYIDTLAGLVNLPDVPPNKKLREKLGKLSTEKLFRMLRAKDPARAKTIDTHNRVRIIRALEIVEALGKVPTRQPARSTSYKFIWVGLAPEDIDKKILLRLKRRWSGIVREVRRLLKQKKVSYKRMQELGLEYRYVSQYVKGKLTKEEAFEKLFTEIRRYAKRQMTYWKKNKKIKWFGPNEYRTIEKYVRNMLG
jgi:tRNA dimethylallyltransferase